MEYLSTRDASLRASFREAVGEGLAPDGGLFLPVEYPDVSARLAAWKAMSYADLAAEVFSLYAGGDLSREQVRRLVAEGLRNFRHPDVTPLVQVGPVSVLELFHGPTWSFKDVALQALGPLFELFPPASGNRTVLGATSGDTGSAAIHGVRGRAGIAVFILFPEGRVSPVQELQMTTVPDANVRCLAIEGSFDDAQAIVKRLFSDLPFKRRHNLSAVNSINWARILAQIVYYFHAWFRWLEANRKPLGEPVPCVVPTGNFGDIFAGYCAMRMGLPLRPLVIATNENDILERFLRTGTYEIRPAKATISPSMDIQVSSNFERLLFHLHGDDDARVRELMANLAKDRRFTVDDDRMEDLRVFFSAGRVGEAECLDTIARVKRDHGYLLDPHSAVGYHVAEQVAGPSGAMSLATAHPGKFAAAVERALGRPEPLPPELAALERLPRRKTVIPADPDRVRAEVERATP